MVVVESSSSTVGNWCSMPSKATNALPESVQEIVDVIGREPALRLVAALPPCGNRPWRRFLYVPRVANDDHLLVQVLGRALADKMVRHFRDCILEPSACLHIHTAAQHAAMVQASAAGASLAEIAISHGCTTRHVRRVLSGNPQGRRKSDAPPEALAHANDNHSGHRRKPS